MINDFVRERRGRDRMDAAVAADKLLFFALLYVICVVDAASSTLSGLAWCPNGTIRRATLDTWQTSLHRKNAFFVLSANATRTVATRQQSRPTSVTSRRP